MFNAYNLFLRVISGCSKEWMLTRMMNSGVTKMTNLKEA